MENILLKDKIISLERAFINIRKRLNKRKPLLLGILSENDDGALFISLSKIQ